MVTLSQKYLEKNSSLVCEASYCGLISEIEKNLSAITLDFVERLKNYFKNTSLMSEA